MLRERGARYVNIVMKGRIQRGLEYRLTCALSYMVEWEVETEFSACVGVLS